LVFLDFHLTLCLRIAQVGQQQPLQLQHQGQGQQLPT